MISKPQCLPAIDRSSTGDDVLSPAPDDTGVVLAGDALSAQLNPSATGGCRDGGCTRARLWGCATTSRTSRVALVHVIDGTATSLPPRFRLRSRGCARPANYPSSKSTDRNETQRPLLL